MNEPTADIENAGELLAYLRRTRRIGADETPARVQTLAGGVSNKTVLVERSSGESWVVKQALPKLRVQADWFSDPARISREAEALRWLPKLTPPGTITPLVFEDAAENLLAMHAVPQPHENWKTMLLTGRVEPDHVRQFAQIIAAIHRRSAESDRGEVSAAFADRSFFESLRLEPYYAYSATQVPAAADFLNELIRDTRARTLSLVHGDFSPKNVLVHRDRLVLLDHEVVHWGDPAFDVGFALTHLLSKAHHLPASRSQLLSAVNLFCDTYASAIGPGAWTLDAQIAAGRHLLGCMLARVVGRSPLEYLTDEQRRRQRDATVRAMRPRPRLPLEDLIALAYAHELFDVEN